MRVNVCTINNAYDFYIDGASYVGAPREHTMMYISKKVEDLIKNLQGKKYCLVFAENGIQVPEILKKENCFMFSDNPQYMYAMFATKLTNEIRKQEAQWGYKQDKKGFFVGQGVTIGKNAYIEPGVILGHNVKIGDNAVILAGSVIKCATIGNDFLCNENAVIGDYSFTMAVDLKGDRIRIPALGRVIIGNNVEIGACDDIATGTCGDTIIEDNVKIDALVHIGHEAHLKKNTEITAGTIVGGFAELGEHSFLGINSSIRNRIRVGENCVVGMGTNVTKKVEAKSVVVGNPARLLVKKEE
ncbi:DapH/DapD/GlmU-related protein [Suilimivivens sp.]|uniref:DapH/DapD/GlmU-related protein n=1 Tax=Suilimivivens sp. TaxID=2981669 RepID=UPI003078C105